LSPNGSEAYVTNEFDDEAAKRVAYISFSALRGPLMQGVKYRYNPLIVGVNAAGFPTRLSSSLITA